ncbi:MAG: hypothetical protein MJY92_03335 [Bacteroidales bacterium]|nr:hypothetical protein [Bacteroidales bacterium]
MKKILFFAAALAVMLTSCQKEKGSDESSAKGVKTITASISNSTKVVMGEDDGTVTKLNWELGDNLFLMDQNGSTGKYSSLNAGETATFNLIDGDGVSPEGQHVAAYPYDGITIDTSGGYPTILFKYSDSQTYTENSFDKNAMPLLAMNETGTNFSFNAMAPVLRLNVKLATAISDVKVNSVVIESASRNLSGFSNWDGSCFYEPGESYGEVGPSITLNCGEGVPISTTATQFCMVIPANEDDVDSDIYPSGDLTITVKTNKGNIVKTSKAAATFVAGEVYNINVSGDPTPLHPYVEIGGKKWSTMNLGATTVAGSPTTSFGDYYAWSETEPRYTGINISSTGGVTVTGWKSAFPSGYSSQYCPSYSGNSLDSAHDAATQAWGDGWRTPTNDEFVSLVIACTATTKAPTPSSANSKDAPMLTSSNPEGGIYTLSADQTLLPEYSGVDGVLFVDKMDNSKRLFFPKTGYLYPSHNTVYTYYWFSGKADVVNYAQHYTIFSGKVYWSEKHSTYYGVPIRPVSD